MTKNLELKIYFIKFYINIKIIILLFKQYSQIGKI